jgi:8-oxo-dGTP pyrophosphatase MutT (NUDIX family)
VVFVPEAAGGGLTGSWQAQVEWEDQRLHEADAIAFWVPRDLATLPGFTTNVEWGRWEGSGKVVLGSPTGAPGTRYLRHYADRHGTPVAGSLPETVAAAVALIGGGARRAGVERRVPLTVWRTASFQRWYQAQRGAGNQLRDARVVWTLHTPATLHYWALHATVWVAAEDRVKDNEVVLSRPDTSVVVLYRRGATLDDTTVVLVREFRVAASTPDGYVHELPGGSGPGPPPAQAIAEVREETGLTLDADRLRYHGSRQLVATMSAHHAHLFSAELTRGELARARLAARGTFGEPGTTERTYVEVTTVGEIRGASTVDWSTLGMLLDILI